MRRTRGNGVLCAPGRSLCQCVSLVLVLSALCVVVGAVLSASILCVSLVAGVASVCFLAAGIMCAPGRSFGECVFGTGVLCVRLLAQGNRNRRYRRRRLEIGSLRCRPMQLHPRCPISCSFLEA